MPRSFVCDLTATLTGPQNSVKEPCSFYCEWQKTEYKIFGTSNSGVLKEGTMSFEEDSPKKLSGSFFENGVEVNFSFELDLFDVSFAIGGGKWTEFGTNNGVRQKYNVKVWDSKLSRIGAKFANGAIEKLGNVQSEISNISKEKDGLVEKVEGLESTVQEVTSKVLGVAEREESLNSKVAEFEQATVDFEELKKSIANEKKLFSETETQLNKNVEQSDILLKNLDSIKGQALKTQETARAALSSSVTVKLAKSFETRKKEAKELREKYDFWFLLSMVTAVVLSIAIVLFATFTESGRANYFEFVLLRLPILVFPVWFAVFCSRKSSIMSRIEEFYAHKQSLSESYEGYSSEIRKISGDENADDEMLALMTINLMSIGKDSASIWDESLKEKHSLLDSVLGDKLEALSKHFQSRGRKANMSDSDNE